MRLENIKRITKAGGTNQRFFGILLGIINITSWKT